MDDFVRLLQALGEKADAALLIGPTGLILDVNKQAQVVFDYTRAELVDHPLHVLIPDRFRKYHAALRNAYNSDPRPRPMGTGRFLVGRRSDGEDVPLEIELMPARTDAGVFTLVVMRQIALEHSDSHQAEQGSRIDA